jgi:hypothetical protein
MMSEPMHKWLNELTHLAYDVDDILDKFSTEMLTPMDGAGSSKVKSLIPTVKLHFNNSELEDFAYRLRKLSTKKKKLLMNGYSNDELPRSPSSHVLDAPVVGREAEKEKIVELLSRHYEPSRNFHAIAIVGMPGVGKTTLAGYVFNDADAMEQFDLKVWVSVTDNFNLERVTRTIFRLVTSQDCDDSDEFSNIQDDLSRAIAGQKFLVVLDDVWSTCDYDSWTKMQSPFHVGAPGSKVLVTTRDKKVVKLIGATEVYDMKVLSDEECLEIFEQHLNIGRPPNFELLQKKIVTNCSGLPLSAKAHGGILSRKETNKWEEILHNKLWSLSDGSNILQVLKLSYHYLPSALKGCFVYCSILPND